MNFPLAPTFDIVCRDCDLFRFGPLRFHLLMHPISFRLIDRTGKFKVE